MGVKSIKEKYKIEHIVQKKEDGNIYIGSSYVSEIIGINSEGKIFKFYKDRKYNDGWSTNEDLKRYQEEMIIDQESGELKYLFSMHDSFDKLFPVYKIEERKIVKKWCEVYEWPNVTTEGELMYENYFYSNYKQAYKELLKLTKNRFKKYNWEVKMRVFKDAFNIIKKHIFWSLKEMYNYIYVRTIERINGLRQR